MGQNGGLWALDKSRPSDELESPPEGKGNLRKTINDVFRRCLEMSLDMDKDWPLVTD